MSATKKPRAAGKPAGRGRALDTREGEEKRDARSVGRPAAAGEPRSERVTVRATPEERARWEAAAARAGLLLGEWIRGQLG